MESAANENPIPPLQWLFESNPIMAWAIVIAGLAILITIAYYVIVFLRTSIRGGDPVALAAEKLSEIEQLKATAYMTDEERRRLNQASPIAGMVGNGEIDPELAVFRKIKEQRMSNQKPTDQPIFEETQDDPND